MRKITLILILILFTSVVSAQEPERIKLTILERLTLGNLMPKETTFSNWKIFNKLRTELAPDEVEIKALDLKPTQSGGTTGNWDAVPEKEIAFGEMALTYFKNKLKQLDEAGKLTEAHLSLYEKFVLKEK